MKNCSIFVYKAEVLRGIKRHSDNKSKNQREY